MCSLRSIQSLANLQSGFSTSKISWEGGGGLASVALHGGGKDDVKNSRREDEGLPP